MTTRKNYEVVDRYGNPVDDDDILPDGGRLRVPLMFRDADTLNPLQRQVMADKVARRGFDDSACRNRPGPVYSDRSAAAKAYTDAAREATNAWKMLPPPTETVADGRRKRRGTTYDPFGRVASEEHWEEEDAAPLGPTYDAAEGRARKQRAYDAMVASATSAWRDPSPLPATTDAAPPVRREAAPVGPTYDVAEGRRRKREAYDRMCREDADAWKDPSR